MKSNHLTSMLGNLLTLFQKTNKQQQKKNHDLPVYNNNLITVSHVSTGHVVGYKR